MASEQPKEEPDNPVDIETGKEEVPDTDVDVGLSADEVEKLREKWGWNEIPAPTTPLYMLFVHQFTGFLAILIEVAAIISLAVQDWTDFGRRQQIRATPDAQRHFSVEWYSFLSDMFSPIPHFI